MKSYNQLSSPAGTVQSAIAPLSGLEQLAAAGAGLPTNLLVVDSANTLVILLGHLNQQHKLAVE